MTGTAKQIGVAKGMAYSMTICFSAIISSIYFDPFSLSHVIDVQGRVEVLALSTILPTLFLFLSIGRMARYRFFNPDEIDGSALTKGSKKALVLQSLIQNTLEQTILVLAVYAAWCLLMPASTLSVALICSILFALGRIMFFRGYERGAAARAVGFALTFYSTALMFLSLIVYQLWRLFL